MQIRKRQICSLRNYLNGEFRNNFDYDENLRIVPILTTNNVNPWYPSAWRHKRKSVVSSNEAFDYVFLLSIQEVVKFFGDSGQLKKRPVQSKEETWHNDGYTRIISDQFNELRIAQDADGEACSWWLRSSGEQPCPAVSVAPIGIIDMHGLLLLEECGVRPALWLKL